MRRDSLLVLGLLIALCLLGGLVIGVATGRWGGLGAAPTQTAIPASASPSTSAQPAAAGEQKSLLVIGVDDASAAQPVFEGCWVLTYRPGILEYYFSSFPPYSSFYVASLGKDQHLSEIFTIDLNQQLGFRYMREAIETRFPALKSQAEVVIDRRGIAELVTQAGGLPIDGASLDGPLVLERYTTQAALGLAERMAFQETVVRSLFGRLGETSWTPESLTLYFSQRPGSRAVQLESFSAGAPLLTESGIHWTVYTPEQETSSTP